VKPQQFCTRTLLKRSVLLGFLVLLAARAVAGGGDASNLSVFVHPYFAGRAVPCLTVYLKDREPKFSGRRIFYISSVQSGDGYTYADVYDPTANHVILWEPRMGSPCDDLRFSRRDWDLKEDVADEPNGSTYMLWRSEVPGLVARCKAGDRVTITMRDGQFVSAKTVRR
jgi:hypothetical protein